MRKLITQLLITAAVAALIVAVVFLHADLRVFTKEDGSPGWNRRVVIPGGAFLGFLLAALLVNADRLARWLTTRRALAAVNVALMSILAAGIIVFVNVIGARHYQVYDWTLRDTYSISARTRTVLEKLEKKIVAHVLVPPGNPFLLNIRGLLDTYEATAPGKFEVRYLNPAQEREAIERTLLALGIDPKTLPRPNVVIFEAVDPAARVPRTKYVTMDELVETDYSMGPDRARLKGFKGEELFTKAILDVSRERRRTVYFLSGHQEFDPYGDPDQRIKAFETNLRNLDYEVKTFKFDFGGEEAAGGKVPDDCDVLVAIGPRARFDDRELAALRKYLEGGGRMLLFLEAVLRQRPASTSVYFDDVRIGELTKDYGLAVEQALVLDPDLDGPAFMLAAQFEPGASDHPITRPLAGIGVFISQAQALTAAGGDDPKLKVTRLLETEPTAVAIRNVDAILAGRDPRAVAEKKGPFILAAAVTKDLGEGKEARLVVGSDASMASDAATQRVLGHMSFLLNAVGWLAEREETISIDSKAPEILSLHLGPGDETRLYLLGLLDMPLLCAAIALAVFIVRRR